MRRVLSGKAQAKEYCIFHCRMSTFLVNAQPRASFEILKVIFRAVIDTKAEKAVIATEHHRGIELLCRDLQ